MIMSRSCPCFQCEKDISHHHHQDRDCKVAAYLKECKGAGIQSSGKNFACLACSEGVEGTSYPHSERVTVKSVSGCTLLDLPAMLERLHIVLGFAHACTAVILSGDFEADTRRPWPDMRVNASESTCWSGTTMYKLDRWAPLARYGGCPIVIKPEAKIYPSPLATGQMCVVVHPEAGFCICPLSLNSLFPDFVPNCSIRRLRWDCWMAYKYPPPVLSIRNTDKHRYFLDGINLTA